MEKQKEQLRALLERLGYEAEKAEEMSNSFLAPEEGMEPELPIDSILVRAQEYARPILRGSLKREFSHEFKGQYMGEAINKIVAISKGKIRRANYPDGNVERALQDLVQAIGQEEGGGDAGIINELRGQVEAMASEKEEALQALRSEFAEKENARLVYDALFAKLGALQHASDGKAAKQLSVDQQHATRAILRELGEDYLLRYDAESKDIGVYNKQRPEERASEGQKLLSVNELVERSLNRNNWIAQSNGGSVNVRQFVRQGTGAEARGNKNESAFRQSLEAQVG